MVVVPTIQGGGGGGGGGGGTGSGSKVISLRYSIRTDPLLRLRSVLGPNEDGLLKW